MSRRKLVSIYYEVYGKHLNWDEYKEPLYDEEIIDMLKETASQADIPFELITKMIVMINSNKYVAKSSMVKKNFDKLLNQEWIHYETIKEGLKNED